MGIAVTPASAQTINWQIGDVDSASHWGPQNSQKLAESLDKATNGRLKLTVYPTESLFKGKDALDAVSKNLAQIYRIPGLHVAGQEQIMEVMDLPLFVPWDFEFRVKLWDALTPLFRERLQKKYNVLLTGILQAEPRMIYTKAKFASLKDLKGRKIRCAGPVETEFTRAIGMVPVTVAPSEIYSALQQGLIDGNWVADAPHFYNKGYEVTKFIYDVGTAGSGFFVLMSEKALQDLPADVRKIVLDSQPAYVKGLRDGSHNGTVKGREWLLKEGMTAVPVSDADRAEMKKAAQVIIDKWVARLDPEARPIYERAKAIVDEYNAKKR
jgi:TRAP-type C4-dicarboxylate transport system substrate-binding protein